MKNLVVACLAGVLVATSFVANAEPETSKISAFEGKYKGRINFGGQATGRATGNFKASQKKENGSLKLQSTLVISGTASRVTESFSIHGRRFSYTLTAVGGGSSSLGVGSGHVKVFRNTIKFNGTMAINGQTYQLLCTAEKTQKGLDVDNSLIGTGGALIAYKLKKKGK